MTTEQELEALLDSLGGMAVRVHEGGGPEDVVKSVCVTMLKLQQDLLKTTEKLNKHVSIGQVLCKNYGWNRSQEYMYPGSSSRDFHNAMWDLQRLLPPF